MIANKLPDRSKVLASTFGVVVAAVLAAGCASVAGWDLPPERAQYTLTLDRGNTHTEWEFWSSEVVKEEAPEGYTCIEYLHWQQEFQVPPKPGSCRAEPLIYLRYDAPLGLDNAVPAPGPHTLKVSTFYQAENPPTVAGLKLWYRTDDSDAWTAVKPVRSEGDGEFTAMIVVSPRERTNEAVSLKAEAWDVDGNRVQQTIDQAYFLHDRSGR